MNPEWNPLIQPVYLEKTVEFNRFFQNDRDKTASAARNCTNSALQTDATTFALPSSVPWLYRGWSVVTCSLYSLTSTGIAFCYRHQSVRLSLVSLSVQRLDSGHVLTVLPDLNGDFVLVQESVCHASPILSPSVQRPATCSLYSLTSPLFWYRQ